MSAPRVFKILTHAEHEHLRANGSFDGSSDDRRDGFIHLSGASQLRGTLERHFKGQDGLVLLTLDSAALGQALRWEPSRGGQLFPHLFAPLTLSTVIRADELSRGGDGNHRIPGWVEEA
ncbi:MAG: DUF952 domain-containing protein [Alphaproteobacteria bacterium]|nr:DUF952 domain-containing protein [Alphaproteobacteria bacterium]